MNVKEATRSQWTVMVLVLLLVGCAQTVEQKAELDAKLQVKVDPTLFTGEPVAPEMRLPLKLALLVPPNMAGAWAALPVAPGMWMTSKTEDKTPRRLQASSIVEQALLKTLSVTFQGKVTSVASMPSQGDNFDGVLELVSVQFAYDERRLTWFPILIPYLGGGLVGQFEASTRLSIQLRLFDAQGRQVWSRDYDDGARQSTWDYPMDSAWLAGVKRAAHDAAWRLSQLVLLDLREWQAAERVKSRTM